MLFSIPIAFAAVILSLAPKAVPSGTRRRAAQLRLDEHCPQGLTACRIPGGGGDYECLSIQTEIGEDQTTSSSGPDLAESCGGCVYGELGLGAESLGDGIE